LAGHIFQARPVWIYTQSNIANIKFTWVHNTSTEKKLLHSTFSYNRSLVYVTHYFFKVCSNDTSLFY
jgi:hypothetical protein